jgi:hypothetical protein
VRSTTSMLLTPILPQSTGQPKVTFKASRIKANAAHAGPSQPSQLLSQHGKSITVHFLASLNNN